MKTTPKASISTKKFLLALNRDLDLIKQKVENCSSFFFLHDYSEFKSSGAMSAIEVATLTLEDRRFFNHFGVELRAIPRVLRRYLRTRKIGGISTIEQQVVRIVTGRYERRAKRKLTELLLAFFINFHLGKREILHFYINNSYFGYGIVGCNKASRLLFAKESSTLKIHEAAIVAACLPVPIPKSVVSALSNLTTARSSDELLSLTSQIDDRWTNEIKFRKKIVLEKYHLMLNNF